jgi:hypothetical protein
MSWFKNKNSGEKASIEGLRHYFASSLIGRLRDYKELVETAQRAPSFDTLKQVFSEEARITQRVRDFTNMFNQLLNQEKVTKDIFKTDLIDYPNFLFQFLETRYMFYVFVKKLIEKNSLLLHPIQNMVATMKDHNKYLKLEAWEFLRVIHAEHSIQNNNAIRETSAIMDAIIKQKATYTRPAINIR